jgi:outer membrane protein assembly factor BamB
VHNLKLKWSVFTDSDVSATPSVKGRFVYTSTWDGSVFAVNTYTGAVMWKQNLRNATSITPGVTGMPILCRHTPVVADDLLLLGIYNPGFVVALNRFTGEFVWSSLLDSHPFAVVTMSGTVFQG